jgi:hypothetical protein
MTERNAMDANAWVLSLAEFENMPCDWKGHRMLKHQWHDTADGFQRCANCKHVRTHPTKRGEQPPTQPDAGQGDVVERMLAEGYKHRDDRERMTAAYAVARTEVIAERDAQWEKAVQTEISSNYGVSEHDQTVFLPNVRARLAQADKPRAPAERVTIKLVSYPTIGDRWQVLLDGKIDDAFGEEITAKRYAAGLRAEING